jgi:hypothetical protein
VGLSRQCTKTGCARRAVATLTYVYGDQTAVLGPLATYAEPHTYDLCRTHAARLTAPRGWEVVRLDVDTDPPAPVVDDLLALADAVRERAEPAVALAAGDLTTAVVDAPRRAHLHVVRDG